jgi:hypothetical protein
MYTDETVLTLNNPISLIISHFKFWTTTIFLYAHLQEVYYKCVNFHKNPISRLGGVALISPSLHTERISVYKLNYLPFQFWTATIFRHAHLRVVYYNCVKFHKNPISRLGGVALTRYMPPYPQMCMTEYGCCPKLEGKII